ncbi:ABC transporter permease [Chloracidobacterium sp. MS 40/45]|uniref:ABC transporter permease n=1 Tax=Chloracidobacterium aggregatum TaxID=2851959 RepID=UPI001B8B0D5F|nr:ABC transporter permease [Chloracidobacterium aggregatum]QUV99805.1 ABC transporter permease [Chloracidobacterium sp. MS 40/45]
MTDILTGLMLTTLTLATPLLLAALGEAVSERAGVVNIGIEGVMLVAAFTGVAVCATTADTRFGPWLGLGAAVMGGLAMTAAFALLSVNMGCDALLVGTALNIFALGATAVARRELVGDSNAAFVVPTLPLWSVPVLALVLIAAVWYWLFRTSHGLGLRAAGEHPAAAASVGLSVARLRWSALLFSGLTCGLAGGYLALGLSNTFVEGMTAGRGFIALAIVIVGRRHPVGISLAALGFGAASAGQFRLQALGLDIIPYQFFLALPYMLTLVAAMWLSPRPASRPATK